MPHYPDQRYLSKMTIIRREAALPDEAVGAVTVREDKRVDIRDVVANGVLPSPHVIVDAARFFGLRNPDSLIDLLQVQVGDAVDTINPLALRRNKKLYSPVNGLVAQILDGRIIVRQTPQIVEVPAGVRGRVTQVLPARGVVIEAVGALIQGMWGNGQRGIAGLRIEPDGGIENVSADQLDVRYLGAIIVCRRPLNARIIRALEVQGLGGLIAPSMSYDLIARARSVEAPILLTEGFGDLRLSRAVLNLLVEYEGQQITLDAYEPTGWDSRRPEIIVNQAARKDDPPSRPNIMLTLREGLTVRVTREPHAGLTGRVADLPKMPVLLDNGLRVPCALVELIIGETVHVPLANLEVLGR
jgi:hypothetical protein